MFVTPFWLRRAVTQLNRGLGLEQLPPRAKAWPDYFDNTDGIGAVRRQPFYKGRTYKGRKGEYPIEKKIGIELHQTAVAFGTRSSRRRFWAKAIKDGKIPAELLAKYEEGREGTKEQIRALVAEQLALHERFWVVPYHYVGLLNGDVLFNNPISRYTYHGNGGNGPLVGVAVEGHFPGIEEKRTKKHNGLDEHTILTARATVRLATKKSREEGAPIQKLFAHRQYSTGRRGDPGEGIWKEVALPVAKELDLSVDQSFVHEGKRIPEVWDPEGSGPY